MSKKGNHPKDVRERNFQIILNLYRENENLSASEISKTVGLSRTTVMKITETMLEMGLIITKGKGLSTIEGGKKPNIFSTNQNYGHVLCFHIKYDAIHARLLNMKLQTVWKEIISIPGDARINVIIRAINKVYNNISKNHSSKAPLIGLVVAVHGVVNTATGTCYYSTHFPSWGTDTPIRELIAAEIEESIPIYIDNWIRYKAFAEKQIGVARNFSNFILVDAGYHGVTAGIFVNNHLYLGNHFLAGEIGHITVQPNDTRLCNCGGRGCLESMVIITRLIENAETHKEDYPKSLIFKTMKEISLDCIIDAFHKLDPLAVHLFEDITRWLAIGLNNISLLFDPEVIILEGDYAKAGQPFLDMLNKKLRTTSMIKLNHRFQIIMNEAHSKATLIGAAAYAINEHINILKKTL